MSHFRFPHQLLLAAIFAGSLTAIPCFADSQARIVRLSDAQGDVQIDRNTGQGYEKAFLNFPITQGAKIRTWENGRAEVEFEDGSTLRLTPQTSIAIPQLSLRDSGGKLSEVRLEAGTIYVNFFAAADDEFDLTFAREKLALKRASHMRITLGDAEAVVAVFKGEVEVVTPTGPVEVAKGHAASFDLASDQHSFANNVDADAYDSWDKQQSQYQQQYSNNSYSNYSPYAYGTSDLNYYGSFFSLPGYGMLWQPYFVGAGWDPWMNGAWTLFPGSGYGWVSSYPWGWTPYHYGTWTFIPLYGWVWQPGGAWMGYAAFPMFLDPPLGFVAPSVPSIPGRRVILVNRGPRTTRSENRIEIVSNSAGLGIPRGSVRNLVELSQAVDQKGFVTTKLHADAASSGWWRGGSSVHSSAGGGNSASTSSSSHASAGHSSGGGHH
ncbi:MAG TPA: FecR family protein [Terriglobales bacterium]|nr:FecR family protein [Terriglobales bacterium]